MLNIQLRINYSNAYQYSQQALSARHIEPAGFAGVAEGAFIRLVRVAAAVHGAALGAQVVHHAVAHGFGIAPGVFGVGQVAGVPAVVQEGGFDDGGGDTGIVADIEPAAAAGGIHKAGLHAAGLSLVGHAVVEATGVE